MELSPVNIYNKQLNNYISQQNCEPQWGYPWKKWRKFWGNAQTALLAMPLQAYKGDGAKIPYG